VLDATDGAHALEVSRGYDGLIHVLLTDVIMPNMTGWNCPITLPESGRDQSIGDVR